MITLLLALWAMVNVALLSAWAAQMRNLEEVRQAGWAVHEPAW